jgi:UbiD family decarboxylase
MTSTTTGTNASTSPTLTTGSDLHTFLEAYGHDYPDEVIHVERPTNAEWELTAFTMQLERAKRFPITIFEHVVADGQRAEIPLVTNLMTSRLRLARAMGTDVRQAGVVGAQRVQERRKPVVVARDQAPVKQVIQTGSEIDVRRFPAPRQHQMDPGRYITEALCLTYNYTSRLDNSAMHRGWLCDRDEIRIFLGPQTHNHRNLREYEEMGRDMPIAFWIGHHPLVLLGAATRVSPDDSHFEAAGGALGAPLRLVPSETLGDDFLVPADAEVVIEGFVPHGQRRPEGPFGEYTRYVGPQRWAPFMKVTAVTRRRNAYWDDVMVGHTHWISSLAREGDVFRAVRQVVPGVKLVHLPMSGTGVAHVYVQIRKTTEGQGKVAAIAALNSFFSIKHAFVFDEDVDIFDDKEVLQALAMRFQGDHGLIVLPGVTGSPLDPSSRDGVTTTKVGFDCTKPVGEAFAERLAIPDGVLERIDPAEIIGRQAFERVPYEPWG